MINIVLFQPEIPPNTGNIIRLAANTGSQLHLIKPFGFRLDDKRMRRAGLDYHEFAGIHVHQDWPAFKEVAATGRLLGISTKGSVHYNEFSFEPGDFLIFGPETRGLPQDIRDELGAERLLRIPMMPDSRSLNLSNAAAVITYEAWRQMGFAASSDH
ncbi:MAG: tRNA (uridine(34)/cytosine(34)/5-carboxymethylaminomethyluridine(34)-2'-O)-methyltransferase TrmL [Proteobacteria bacterium]|nr:tRNA (uridine(34)/cytosine(34)/5-carboxymethylaminomethyluridine(34)-2'-O)-methyltransferase TrmL [Pseudomonadota bacterium]MDA0926499.1 tRNA (uridine(34)/cytosine(34)/5-carboxymethylaminomethyluridine(34)-2'-O)-methyltransferase TrmL [Pseudomonadota bacterium]